MAKRGLRVVMVCRDRAKGEQARAEIQRAVAAAAVDLLVCDLSSQRQIRDLAQTFLSRFQRLDVLIHNAGVVSPERRLTEDGLETTFAVNHLAPFLLTQLLLPMLLETAPARVVVVASQVESRATIHLDDLQLGGGYTPLAAYFQSKLANVLFTYELARRLAGTRVTANCLHPGVIATNLLSDYMGRSRLLGVANRLSYPGPEKGAKTIIRMATDPELEAKTGAYFHEARETKSSAQSYDPILARRLWEVSETLTASSARL